LLKMSKQMLPHGVYVPVPTFFQDNSEQELDLETLGKHVKYLCQSGVSGIVILGSSGEAVHVSDEERMEIIKRGKTVMNGLDPNLKLIAGCSAQSVNGTLKLIRDAHKSGAQYALVLPPSYYLNWINSNVILTYYTSVADRSPIPIIIYNYPGVTQQLDIAADTIVELAHHPNIVGIKCTD